MSLQNSWNIGILKTSSFVFGRNGTWQRRCSLLNTGQPARGIRHRVPVLSWAKGAQAAAAARPHPRGLASQAGAEQD